MQQGYLATWLDQGKEMTEKVLSSSQLIYKNKLWEGFFRHRTVMVVSALAVIIIPWSVFRYLVPENVEKNIPADVSGIQANIIEQSVSLNSLFSGGNKYILLILIQMLVIHVSNRTLEYLSGVKLGLSVKMMIDSQLRVVVVSLRNWVFELIIGILISVALGIIGSGFLVPYFKFFVGAYFVGFIFIDNFNHLFGMNIKESAVVVQKYAGAALAVGIMTKILFLMPFLGALIASFVCTVGATWFMYRHEGYRIDEGQLKY